ncbi:MULTISPECIES: type VI secretion system lipoprotein TssJ [Vibrio]|uniref:type VI secretion system lipoprotein TssJ n=1 Tax=Vibrio TaxID=662 RepID=UPI003D0FF908
MRWPIFVSTLLFALLSGCSSTTTPVTTSYALQTVSDDTINPYRSTAANPVVVRLYQLKSKESFNQSSFIALYNGDLQALGSSLIVKQVLPPMMPASTVNSTLDINKSTQYLAALVEYANYQQSNGKAIAVVPTDGESSLVLRLSGLNVELDVVPPESSWWQIF